MSWHTTPLSIQLQSNDLEFEIQERSCYLKNLALNFMLLVLKLCPIQAVISSYCSFFCATSADFLAYVGGVLVTNLFSLLLIDRYTLAIQQTITLEEYLRYSFFICSNLLNRLRSLGTMVITTECGSKSLSLSIFLQK